MSAMPSSQARPHRLAVCVVAHRRIHLRVGAEALVAIGRDERQMMRRDFDRRDVLVVLEEGHFLAPS